MVYHSEKSQVRYLLKDTCQVKHSLLVSKFSEMASWPIGI